MDYDCDCDCDRMGSSHGAVGGLSLGVQEVYILERESCGKPATPTEMKKQAPWSPPHVVHESHDDNERHCMTGKIHETSMSMFIRGLPSPLQKMESAATIESSMV